MGFLVIVLIGVAIGAVVYFLDRRSTAKANAALVVPNDSNQSQQAMPQDPNALQVALSAPRSDL